MRLFLIACALTLIASSVNAGTTCTTLGTTTICFDSSTGQSITCTRLGDTTICN